MKGRLSFIIIILFSFFMNLSIANAETCSAEKLNELKQKAENIEVTTEFDESNIDFGLYDRYQIIITGLIDDLYIRDNTYEFLYDTTDVKDGNIIGLITTEVKKINIYSKQCPNQILKTIDIKLIKYNKFSEYEECKGISGNELEVCDKFYDGDLTYSVFKREIEKYNNSKNNILNEDNNLIVYGIIAGVILVIIVIAILIIKHNKNKLD